MKKPGNKPVTKEMNTDAGMDPMLGGCKIGRKESCWQCYKLEVIPDMLQIEELPTKYFWSHQCVSKYKIQNLITWAFEGWLSKFLKIKGGTLVGSNWYWSQECAKKDNPEVDETYEDEEEEEEIVEKEEEVQEPNQRE